MIDLKASYPAVSQIYNLMFLLSTDIILAPNSTPMVTSCFYLNLLSMNYSSMQLFPTPVSPIIMYLNKKEYDISKLGFYEFNDELLFLINFYKFVIKLLFKIIKYNYRVSKNQRLWIWYFIYIYLWIILNIFNILINILLKSIINWN